MLSKRDVSQRAYQLQSSARREKLTNRQRMQSAHLAMHAPTLTTPAHEPEWPRSQLPGRGLVIAQYPAHVVVVAIVVIDLRFVLELRFVIDLRFAAPSSMVSSRRWDERACEPLRSDRRSALRAACRATLSARESSLPALSPPVPFPPSPTPQRSRREMYSGIPCARLAAHAAKVAFA